MRVQRSTAIFIGILWCLLTSTLSFAGEWYVGADFGRTSYDSIDKFKTPFTNAASNFVTDPIVNQSVIDQEAVVVADAIASGFDTSSTFSTSFSGDFDDSVTPTLGIFAGYRFNRYLAVEFAYTDLGDYDANVSGNNSAIVKITDPLSTPPNELIDTVTVGETGDSSANLDASAFSVSVLGSLPLGKKHLVYGKVGVARWETDLRIRAGATIGQPVIPGQVPVGNFSDDGTDAVFGVGYQAKIAKSAFLRIAYDVYKDIAIGDFDLEDDIERISIGLLFDL